MALRGAPRRTAGGGAHGARHSAGGLRQRGGPDDDAGGAARGGDEVPAGRHRPRAMPASSAARRAGQPSAGGASRADSARHQLDRALSLRADLTEGLPAAGATDAPLTRGDQRAPQDPRRTAGSAVRRRPLRVGRWCRHLARAALPLQARGHRVRAAAGVPRREQRLDRRDRQRIWRAARPSSAAQGAIAPSHPPAPAGACGALTAASRCPVSRAASPG
jgi:hypothetical protein